MNFKDFIKILFLLLFIGLTIYSLILLRNVQKSSLYNTTPIIVNITEGKSQKNCKNIRTPCDPKDPNACNNSCTEDELTCVSLDSINPQGGSKFNGGGNVCLPQPVNIDCNSDKGGVLVWTGYAEVNDQTWSCLCMYPDRFNGPGCNNVSPGFCTGGTVNTSNLSGKYPDDSLCTCPSGTRKMVNSYNNLPFCAPSFLSGNQFEPPNWSNIYFNPSFKTSATNPPDITQSWSQNITNEIYYPNNLDLDSNTDSNKSFTQILSNINPGDQESPLDLQTLTLSASDEICSSACKKPFVLTPNEKMCDCKNNSSTNYSDQIKSLNTVFYTYYTGAEITN